MKVILKEKNIYGGAIGLFYGNIEIDNFYNKGEIYQEESPSNERWAYAGGCVGLIPRNSNGILKNCYNIGKITSIDWSAGGIIGETQASTLKIINCYNKNEINGNIAGGIVGMISGGNSEYTPSIEITNCYQTGNLTGEKYPTAAMLRKNTKADITIKGGYYLETTASVGIENPSAGGETVDTSEALSEEYMKSEEFVKLLNEEIENEKGLKKWKYNQNDYPTFK